MKVGRGRRRFWYAVLFRDALFQGDPNGYSPDKRRPIVYRFNTPKARDQWALECKVEAPAEAGYRGPVLASQLPKGLVWERIDTTAPYQAEADPEREIRR